LLDTLKNLDPLSHFVNFERFLWDASDANKKHFTSMIRNEMPVQTFLELGIWYDGAGQKSDALKVMEMAPSDAEVRYWRAYLAGGNLQLDNVKPGLVFPFRPETAKVISELMKNNDDWMLKYHMALLKWNGNDLDGAKALMEEIGTSTDYAPFYAARAKLYKEGDSAKQLADLEKARSLDSRQWRYARALINYWLAHNNPQKAVEISSREYRRNEENYLMAMLHVKSLMATNDYGAAEKVLDRLEILPNEGATGGRQLYHEVKLTLALRDLKEGKWKNAVKHAEEARDWPERLGSGRPYEEDIDERAENWILYQAYTKLGDEPNAQLMLEKIITHSGGRNPSLNNVISALALRKAGREEDGKLFLENILATHPSSEIAKWALDYYEGRNVPVPAEIADRESFVLINEPGI
jgi:hypothetical protein